MFDAISLTVRLAEACSSRSRSAARLYYCSVSTLLSFTLRWWLWVDTESTELYLASILDGKFRCPDSAISVPLFCPV